jgi:hypothetical protein
VQELGGEENETDGGVLASGEGGEVDGIVRCPLFRTMETRLEIRIKSPTYFDAPPDTGILQTAVLFR